MAVNSLSPYQLALQSIVGSGRGAHTRLTPDILGRVADQVFGPFPITPGSQIISQTADRAEWIDAEGFRHVATRSLDGRDPNAGQVREQTDRPPVLPAPQGQRDLLSQLTGGQGVSQDFQAIRDLAARLQQPAQLAALDPETQAALQAITANTMAQLKQQFERDQANQLAALFGNRIQSSSIATNALAQLLQQQGLVTSSALSDAATRELDTRRAITDDERARMLAALQGLIGGAGVQTDLLANLTGQQTTRDIATGGLGLDFAKLAESRRQANLGFELDQQEADRRLAESRAILPKILAGLGIAGQAAGGIGAFIGALGDRRNRNTPTRTENIGSIAGGYF